MAEIVNTPDFVQQYFDLDGKPLVGGKLAFFEVNTDIPSPVYTSGGSVALGNEIALGSSGIPETQYALEAGKEYTVKAFDSDNVLIWTRNNVFGGGAGGSVSGEYVPMTGTSISDPIVGPLVLQDTPGAVLDVRNTVSKTGSTLVNTFGGQTSFNRNGLDIQMVNTRGEYLYNKARIQNTQNGFPGYPDYAELSILDLKLHRELDDNGSRKEKSLNLSIDSTIYNTIESKGAHLNVSCDKSFVVQAPTGVVNLMGQNIELTPSGSGFVYINNNGTLRTQWLSLGTHNYHQDVSEIYTSTTTGDPSDYQLITAKAALEAASGMSNPMTSLGDMIIGGASGTPTRLQYGTAGQLLTMGASGVPEWSNKPAACQENYSIIDSTGVYSASSYNDQLLTCKVIANVDRIYSQLGFGLKKGQTGTTGKFGLAIYDSGKNLMASTPIFQITENYPGEIYWVDTEATFKLNAGDEYFFAFWCTDYPASNLVQFLGHQQVSTFDADLVGILYGQQGLTEMPATLGTLSYGQMVPYMAVR